MLDSNLPEEQPVAMPEMESQMPDMPAPLPDAPPQASKVAPKGARTATERNQLGLKISAAINQGIAQKGTLGERIRRNEEYFENRVVKPPHLPHAGAGYYHIPVTKPRLTKRMDSLVQTVMQQSPVFRFKRIGDQEPVKEVEQVVQFALDLQDWQQDLSMAAQIGMLGNNILFRVTFQEHPNGLEKAVHTGPFAGPIIDVYHSDYVSIFPATMGPLSEKRLIGHCTEVRKAEVMQKIKSGYFFKDAQVKSANDELIRAANGKEGDRQNLKVVPEEDDDSNMNIWDALYKCDMDGRGEKWYRVIVWEKGQALLRIEEYPADLPIWYVMGQIDREYGTLWTEGSPAQDIQCIQILMNDAVNRFVWALERIGSMTILGEGSPGDAGDLVNLPPNVYVPVRNLRNTAVASGQGSLAGADVLISWLREFADGASGVSDAISASSSGKASETATEQQIKLMGFQLSGFGDLTALSPALVQIAKLILAQIAKYWDRYAAVYGDALAIEDPAVLKLPYLIELAGKAPEDAPQTQMEMSKLLLDVASAFPNEGIPVSELVRMIVMNSGLANADDLLAAMDQTQEWMFLQQQMLGQDQFLQTLMQMTGQLQQQAAQGKPFDESQLAQLLQSIPRGAAPDMAPTGAQPVGGNPAGVLAG